MNYYKFFAPSILGTWLSPCSRPSPLTRKQRLIANPRRRPTTRSTRSWIGCHLPHGKGCIWLLGKLRTSSLGQYELMGVLGGILSFYIFYFFGIKTKDWVCRGMRKYTDCLCWFTRMYLAGDVIFYDSENCTIRFLVPLLCLILCLTYILFLFFYSLFLYFIL